MTLSTLPTTPEESWRRTDPSAFFLPESEVLSCNGLSVEGFDAGWKASFFNVEPAAFAATLQEKASAEWQVFTQHFEAATWVETVAKRLVVVAVGHGCVRIFSPHRLPGVTLGAVSQPWAPAAALPGSAISQATADRLKASSPHQLHITVDSAQLGSSAEAPLIWVWNHVAPDFGQTYVNLSLDFAPHSTAEVLVWERGGNFSMHRTHLALGEGAQVKALTALVSDPEAQGAHEASLLLEHTASFGKGACLHESKILLPVATQTRYISTHLFDGGEAAESHAGAALLAKQGKLDFEPLQVHRSPRTTSDLLVKILLSGRARSIFHGLVNIAREAPGCRGFQLNKNMLLSPRARVDAIPRLEILPDDVQCKHGSATGEVDAKQVYYLTSRGFSEAEARALILEGFVMETLEPIARSEDLLFVGSALLNKALAERL